MAIDPTSGPASPPTDPLRQDVRAQGTWNYLVNYVLLGACAVLIVWEIIESGAWPKLVVPLVLISLAIGNIARLHAAERRSAEPNAAADGGRDPGS